MNKLDKGMLAMLIIVLVVLFLCIDEVKHLRQIIDSNPVCEAYGLTEKIRAFDPKSKILKMQCEG